MLIHEIKLTNLLSFGPDTMSLKLRDLNVLIGPNGSGKSNLIEAISLLQAAPTDLATPIRKGGGIIDWLWKGAPTPPPPTAQVEVSVEAPHPTESRLRHLLEFTQSLQHFDLTDEIIENDLPNSERPDPCRYYHAKSENASHQRQVAYDVPPPGSGYTQSFIIPTQSALAIKRDTTHYPQITYLWHQYEHIHIYRNWQFGRDSNARIPQLADQRNDYLEEDCSNLALLLNKVCLDPSLKSRLLRSLRELYPEFDDIHVNFEGGTVLVYFIEGDISIPASRLSDGTLRYLCLLVILLNPNKSSLICIEEPELGLHPDVIPRIAELLKEASQHTQLIVTTHSSILVDALSDDPEDIVVCEKLNGQTTMKRLEHSKLKVWLEDFGLGQLWRRGDLGGNRW